MFYAKISLGMMVYFLVVGCVCVTSTLNLLLGQYHRFRVGDIFAVSSVTAILDEGV